MGEGAGDDPVRMLVASDDDFDHRVIGKTSTFASRAVDLTHSRDAAGTIDHLTSAATDVMVLRRGLPFHGTDTVLGHLDRTGHDLPVVLLGGAGEVHAGPVHGVALPQSFREVVDLLDLAIRRAVFHRQRLAERATAQLVAELRAL